MATSSAPCSSTSMAAEHEHAVAKTSAPVCFGSPARGPIKRDVPTKTPSKEARHHGKAKTTTAKPSSASAVPPIVLPPAANTPFRRPSREEVEIENEKLLLAPHKPVATREPYAVSGAQPRAFRRLDFTDDDE